MVWNGGGTSKGHTECPGTCKKSLDYYHLFALTYLAPYMQTKFVSVSLHPKLTSPLSRTWSEGPAERLHEQLTHEDSKLDRNAGFPDETVPLGESIVLVLISMDWPSRLSDLIVLTTL